MALPELHGMNSPNSDTMSVLHWAGHHPAAPQSNKDPTDESGPMPRFLPLIRSRRYELPMFLLPHLRLIH